MNVITDAGSGVQDIAKGEERGGGGQKEADEMGENGGSLKGA